MGKTIRRKDKLREIQKDADWSVDLYNDTSFPIWRRRYQHLIDKYTTIRDSRAYALRDKAHRHWKTHMKFYNSNRHRSMETHVLNNIVRNLNNEEYEPLFVPYKRVENPWSWD